ncbi:MAG: zinc ribbon domain-containing protein, partial [Clostridiales bacterium]|nr:zinc ribbon domain-containing protein [Clostridiales bacterium]
SNEIQQNKEVVSSAGLGNNHTVAENSQAIAENSKETTNNNQALEKTIQNEAHVDEIAQVEDSESEPEGNNEKKYKFCTECGNKLMKNAIFCAKCGKKMN